MKEYLTKKADGTYTLTFGNGDIEVPDGACYALNTNTSNPKNVQLNFYNEDLTAWYLAPHWKKSNPVVANNQLPVLWKRYTQPEELPFVDDDPRHDSVNHPSHYTNGKVECIDALESATVGKTGIEAVCVANTIKYLWRYEDKNGLEDVKKAKWYLDKLLTILENDSKH